MEDSLNSNAPIMDTTAPNDITSHVQPETPKEYIENKDNLEDLDLTFTRWKCIKCGYVYEGVTQIKKCPKCGNENPDMFTDVD